MSLQILHNINTRRMAAILGLPMADEIEMAIYEFSQEANRARQQEMMRKLFEVQKEKDDQDKLTT